MNARRRLALGVCLVALLSACGSTLTPTSGAGSDGQDGGLGTSSTSGATDTSATGTTGVATGDGSTAAGTAGGGSSGSSTSGSAASGTSTAGDPTSTATSGTGSVPINPGGKKLASIQIGLLDIAPIGKGISALGGDSAAFTGSGSATAKALIDYYNKHGGIGGRHIETVEFTANLTDANYETDYQAACAAFTQDHHVDVVLTEAATFFAEGYEKCLAAKGVPDIEYLNNGTDKTNLAQYPTLFTPTAPSLNRSYSALLKGLTANGFLTPKTKLGIILENCPFNTRTYTNTLAPLIKQVGLNVTRRDVDCATGFQDVATFESQVSADVLPFVAAGVSRVIFVTGFQALAAFAFENQASSQHYAPSYGFTSDAGIPGAASEFSADAQSRMAGVGWSPIMDVTSRTPTTAADRRCVSVLASQGIQLKTKGDDQAAGICDLFFLLEAGLKAAPTAGHGQITAALNNVGTSYQSAFDLTAATRIAPGAHDGPAVFSTFGYKASCSCFVYTTPPARDQ